MIINRYTKIIEEIKDIPEENLPKLLEIIHYLKIGILINRVKKKKIEPLLDIDDIAIETGISDLAENHDYYLYGVQKK